MPKQPSNPQKALFTKLLVMFFTVLLFIAILAVLILVHELGHFFVAKKSGVKVEEFGLGFPPRVFGIKRGETLYSLNLLPIGGFVKIYGEDGDKKNDPRSFSSRSIRSRSLIVGAGVLMNILLAIVIFSVAHGVGLPQAIDDEASIANIKNVQVRITDVSENSPAENAGFKWGDSIIGMELGEDVLVDIKSITDVQGFISRHVGEEVTISIARGDEILKRNLVPRSDPPQGEGAIGIAMLKTGVISYPFYIAPLKGVESTVFVTFATLRAFWGIISDFVSTGTVDAELSGPVGIAVMTGQVQQMGFIFLMQFIALISINLAIINIMPFPALDGGRLMFFAIEKIKGSPVNQKYEKMAHTVGFALLILLMIVITFRDIGKFL